MLRLEVEHKLKKGHQNSDVHFYVFRKTTHSLVSPLSMPPLLCVISFAVKNPFPLLYHSSPCASHCNAFCVSVCPFVSGSICPAVSLQSRNRPSKQTSQWASTYLHCACFISTKVLRDMALVRDSEFILNIMHRLDPRLALFLCAGFCVACLSN